MLIALLLLASPPHETVVRERLPSKCVAAIALRDHVPLEQQLGTKAFTVPYLASSYDRYVYVTADEEHDGRAQVIDALRDMRRQRCVVDLLFLAHGHDFVSWLRDVPSSERPRLRLVYDTGGGSADYADQWLDVGARAFVGHPSSNVAPIFYAFFLPAWLGGVSLDDAVARSNARTYEAMRALRVFFDSDAALEELWRGTRAVVAGDVHALHRPRT